MTIITCNGHVVEPGCVLDNHWGWHNHARMIEVATGLGFVISDEDQAVVDRYDSGESEDDDNDSEVVSDLMDEAERWLNDNTDGVGCFWTWHDGDFVLVAPPDSIYVTPESSASQFAVWTLIEADLARWSASVHRSSDTDERGFTGWAYTLSHSPAEGVGFHYTFARPVELIYGPGTPLEALETLSSFVGAWHEAHRYGTEGSENWDLFPDVCVPFLDRADEFQMDATYGEFS